jgi:acyl homoserine lactone synthase
MRAGNCCCLGIKSDSETSLQDSLPRPICKRPLAGLASSAHVDARTKATATHGLYAGMIELGLSRRLTDIITVTDVRMERILRRAEWPLRRIGQARSLGQTRAIAGYLEVSMECLARVRSVGKLRSPVLWEPAIRAA